MFLYVCMYLYSRKEKIRRKEPKEEQKRNNVLYSPLYRRIYTYINITLIEVF